MSYDQDIFVKKSTPTVPPFGIAFKVKISVIIRVIDSNPKLTHRNAFCRLDSLVIQIERYQHPKNMIV